MSRLIKAAIKRTLLALGFDIRRVPPPGPASLPDREFYRPLFSPWNGYGETSKYVHLAEPYTLVTPERLYVLYALALNAVRLHGEFWECGVYKGGTARMLAEFLASDAPPGVRLHLFDTFNGMPKTDKDLDLHQEGDFSDTSLADVQLRVGNRERVVFHRGWIPETFRDMQNSVVAMAHVDVDIYRSVLDCCEFIYPRLQVGGVMVFDDYGFPSCPGARRAVDEYFANKQESPIVLQTGQAIVIRMSNPPHLVL